MSQLVDPFNEFEKARGFCAGDGESLFDIHHADLSVGLSA